MFHVKQFLFLPLFHVEQSCFSVRQTAARPIPPSRCHSERSEESVHWKAQAVVLVKRQSSFFLRKPVNYNCGCMMKSNDSSSQAPQNDKEKRIGAVSRFESGFE